MKMIYKLRTDWSVSLYSESNVSSTAAQDENMVMLVLISCNF